jgi:hypothetical protein
MPAVVVAVSMNGSSFEGRSVMLILRDWRFSTANDKEVHEGPNCFLKSQGAALRKSCGTLIAPNRWLFPIMIFVSAADREWQLTLC